MAVIVWQAAYPVLAACILYEISRENDKNCQFFGISHRGAFTSLHPVPYTSCMREKTSIIHKKIHNLGSIPASGIQAPEPLKDRGHIFRQIAFPFHFFPCDGMSKLQAGSMKHLSSDLDNCTPDPEFRRPAV